MRWSWITILLPLFLVGCEGEPLAPHDGSPSPDFSHVDALIADQALLDQSTLHDAFIPVLDAQSLDSTATDDAAGLIDGGFIVDSEIPDADPSDAAELPQVDQGINHRCDDFTRFEGELQREEVFTRDFCKEKPISIYQAADDAELHWLLFDTRRMTVIVYPVGRRYTVAAHEQLLYVNVYGFVTSAQWCLYDDADEEDGLHCEALNFPHNSPVISSSGELYYFDAADAVSRKVMGEDSRFFFDKPVVTAIIEGVYYILHGDNTENWLVEAYDTMRDDFGQASQIRHPGEPSFTRDGCVLFTQDQQYTVLSRISELQGIFVRRAGMLEPVFSCHGIVWSEEDTNQIKRFDFDSLEIRVISPLYGPEVCEEGHGCKRVEYTVLLSEEGNLFLVGTVTRVFEGEIGSPQGARVWQLD